MKNKSIIIFGFAFLLAITSTYFFKKAQAAKDMKLPIVSNFSSSDYKVGDEVADFSLKNIDGEMLSLASFKDAKGFIIVFTSNHCPFSQAYEDRVIQLNDKFQKLGYPVIAINPNDPSSYEEDSFENMVKKASEKGYTFPYLSDATQVVSQAFGANRTPQVFVISKENGKNIVKYTGAIDDNPQSTEGIHKKYVEDAVGNLLAGKPVVNTTTKAIGCAIRYKM